MINKLPTTDKPLAFSYIRMSTEVQLKGDSLRRQKEASKTYADLNNLYLVEDWNLQDIGVSAYKGANIDSGSLGIFLEAIKNKQIPTGSYLLVESLDRLSRQEISKSVGLFLDITNSGVNLVTLIDNQVYLAGKTEMHQMLYSIVVMSRAFEESQTKSVRLSAAWSNKRNNLNKHKLTKISPAWLYYCEHQKNFKVVTNRKKIIKKIFNLAANGMGSQAIAKQLNKNSEETFGSSKIWVVSYISKILNNRAVLGEFQPYQKVDGKRKPVGAVIPNYFPRIIDDRQFLFVKSKRSKRASVGNGRKGTNLSNLFTHIAKCDYCNSPMHFVNKGKGSKGGTYLKCSSAINGSGCVKTSWRYTDFETSFLYFVRELDLSLAIASAKTKTEKEVLEEQIIAIEQEIKDKSIIRDRMFSLIGDTDSSANYINDKINESTKEIDQLNKNLSKVSQEIQKLPNEDKIDADQLEKAIARIQNTNIAQSYTLRSAVASRLQEIIVDLRLRTEGLAPLNLEAEKILSASKIDKEESNKILAQLNKNNFKNGNFNPSFKVHLADGTVRQIIIDKKDPKKIIKNMAYNGELDNDYKAHYSSAELVKLTVKDSS